MFGLAVLERNSTLKRENKYAPMLIMTAAMILTLSGCSSDPRNPCEKDTWDDLGCQDAVTRRGFYHGGRFHPLTSPYTHSWYRQNHEAYVRSGGIQRGGFGTFGTSGAS